jgi:hypothetical protein
VRRPCGEAPSADQGGTLAAYSVHALAVVLSTDELYANQDPGLPPRMMYSIGTVCRFRVTWSIDIGGITNE